ncbi:MAG: Hsp70 family protein, partial [Nanoarchaeota archaeon]|nr:Hsp70 family protein [Nanoarchaeota archaeon]
IFDIDANGIVHVTAKDLGTGKEQSIKITASQKLNDEEVERMRKEAEQHAEEDKKRKEEVETINQADTLVYSTEKLFKDFEGKVDTKELETVKGKIMELKELLKPEKKDAAEIKAKMDEVNQLVQKMSTEMYKKVAEEQAKKQKQAGAKETAEKPKKKGDKVVDAEYKEEGDEKKKEKK